MICTEKCWTPIPCPDHGDMMEPAGHAVSDYDCCGNKNKSVNTRHLWNEHDSSRVYLDPIGWDNHVAECKRCQDDE